MPVYYPTMVAIMPFVTIIIVVIAVSLFHAYRLSLRHRQLGRVFEERKLLIEKGVTELPAIRLPETEKARDGFGNLKAGVILLVLGATLAFLFLLLRARVGSNVSLIGYGLIIGAIGFALVLLHFLVRALQRREKRESGGPESKSPEA